MKYIKEFEMNEGKPEVGDYVICAGRYSGAFGYVKNNIGKLDMINQCQYGIEYKYNKNRNTYNYLCNVSDILYWSKNKKELEMILNTNKFNI